MKADIQSAPHTFKPFTLMIECETIDEARMLWHCLNQSANAILSDADSACSLPLNPGVRMVETWAVLNKHMAKHNMKG